MHVCGFENEMNKHEYDPFTPTIPIVGVLFSSSLSFFSSLWIKCGIWFDLVFSNLKSWSIAYFVGGIEFLKN